MTIPQTEAELLRLIADKVEESLSLDYKRAEALTAIKGDLAKEISPRRSLKMFQLSPTQPEE